MRVRAGGLVVAVTVLVLWAAPGTASAQGTVECHPNQGWKVEPLDVTVEQGGIATFTGAVTNRDTGDPSRPSCQSFETRVGWLLPDTVDQTPVADVDGDSSGCGFQHCDIGAIGSGQTKIVTVRVRAGEITGDSQIKFSGYYKTRRASDQTVVTSDMEQYVAQLHIVPATTRDTTPPVIGKTSLSRGGKKKQLLYMNTSLSEDMTLRYDVEEFAKGRKDSKGKCKKYVRTKSSQPKWEDLPKSLRCKDWFRVRPGAGPGVKGKNKILLDGKFSKLKTYRVVLGGTDLADNKAKSVTSAALKATK